MATDADQRRRNDAGPAPERQRLVSIETQREFDLFSGEWAERVFVKLYVAARTSGLLAAISDRDWKTLCCLATYMDGDGYCFPSQAELARALGCSRQMANERVKSLAAFRFEGNPVLLIVKPERTGSGTWARNGYRVLSLSSLAMYESEPANDRGNDSARRATGTVSSELDTVSVPEPTVSSPTVTVQLDTNKNQSNQPELESDSIIRTDDRSDLRANDEVAGGEMISLIEAVERWQTRTAPDGDTTVPALSAQERPRPAAPRRRQADPAYQTIQSCLRDFGREFNDRAPLGATTTRAYNLWRRSGIAIDEFVEQLYAARTIVKERTGSIRAKGVAAGSGFRVTHGMGYYFAVLEDLLGLRDADRPGPAPLP
jgi:hypothetical protein